jgi:hypothetical protein
MNNNSPSIIATMAGQPARLSPQPLPAALHEKEFLIHVVVERQN